MIEISRRKALLGALGLIAAPAIVKASSLMRIVSQPVYARLVLPSSTWRHYYYMIGVKEHICQPNEILDEIPYRTMFCGIPVRINA